MRPTTKASKSTERLTLATAGTDARKSASSRERWATRSRRC